MRLKAYLSFLVFLIGTSFAHATANHEYGPNEYVTVAKGISPDGRYAITTHGEGDLGYDNFHAYLTDAITGKNIEPLLEVHDNLDTRAAAIGAKWSNDSKSFSIVYRIDRHQPLKAVFYHLDKGHAVSDKGWVDATDELAKYWGEQCSQSQPSLKVFGK